MKPSSSNTGFFQEQPVIRNQFHDDVSLQRITRLFLPQPILDRITPGAAQLGDDVLSQQVFDWVSDPEHNQPYLRGSGRDAFGKPKSELVVTEGWRKLQDFGFQKGFVALNYDSDYAPYNRLVQFIHCHLWEGSCANTLCPAAMQDGAARLLQRHLSGSSDLSSAERQVFQNAYDHLTSRDPAKAWTSGQWMTERTGGSDVSRTETVATYDPYPDSSPSPLADANEKIPLGPWSISGLKWFSSATDSQMAILLARTHPSKPVSAFLAPMRRYNPSLTTGDGTELNGITIHRLKHKLGTQSLPTAELELNNTRAWLIGEEGHGIHEVSTILTITRVHTTVSSVGYLGRGLAIARGFAAVREVGVGRGRRVSLSSHPLHMRTLADLTVDYHGLMLLVYYTVYLLGLDEHPRPPSRSPSSTTNLITPPPHPLTPSDDSGMIPPLLRTLSSLHKSHVCHATIPLLYNCMASLGGVGYLLNDESQHINVARLFRDACVGAIWEGTTDVLAGDTVRALKRRRSEKRGGGHGGAGVGGEEVAGKGLGAVGWFVETGLGWVAGKLGGDGEGRGERGWSGRAVEGVRKVWEELKERIEKAAQEELLPDARGLTFRLAEVLIAVLYLVDATVHPGAEIDEMCRRYLVKNGFVDEQDGERRKDLAMDQAIVYGAGKVPSQDVVSGSKL